MNIVINILIILIMLFQFNECNEIEKLKKEMNNLKKDFEYINIYILSINKLIILFLKALFLYSHFTHFLV